MKITYISFICDVGYNCMYRLIKSIEKVHSDGKYDYEIFIFDNRDKNKNIIINLKNPKAKLLKSRGNCLWWCKEDGVLNYAKGDWVRFVDADDEVIGLPKDENLQNKDADMIFGNNASEHFPEHNIYDSTDFIKNFEFTKDKESYLYWRQVYNINFIKKFFQDKKTLNAPLFFFTEDNIFSTAVFEYKPKIILDSNNIYSNKDSSSSLTNQKMRNVSFIKNIRYKNMKSLLAFIKRLFKSEKSYNDIILRIKSIILSDSMLMPDQDTFNWLYQNIITEVFSKEEIERYFVMK